MASTSLSACATRAAASFPSSVARWVLGRRSSAAVLGVRDGECGEVMRDIVPAPGPAQ